jgi:iron complex transport system permease protein
LVRALASGPYDPTRLLLAGVAVSSTLASATGLILVLVPASQLLRTTTYWLFGGLGTPHWSALAMPACLLIASLAFMHAQSERLDRLTLGSDVAQSLGVEVSMLRRNVLLMSIALTAVAVAAAGLIGFVGLIAPHAAQRLVGRRHRHRLPLAALCGALLVMLADTIARTAFAPREVPVGLLTAAVGGPFFLVQLQRGLR